MCWRSSVWSWVQENRSKRSNPNNNSRSNWWSRRVEVSCSVKRRNKRACSKLGKVPPSWKCQHRNNAARRTRHGPDKFYAELKKKDEDDYKPESLKIMQGTIERHLKDKISPLSIVRTTEFHSTQEVLNAKALSLRQQGKSKRLNKVQSLTPDEESAPWEKGLLGDFNGKVLRNANLNNLTEQLRLRGRQEHYDAYVEDLVIRQQ